MKITIVRTDKKQVQHLTVKSVEWFIERIKTDTKEGDIEGLRSYYAHTGSMEGYDQIKPVARIYPSAELRKSENGLLEAVAFNGVVTLHVGSLMRPEDVEAVKEAAMVLPTTLAAFMGADGRSVEVLVSVARKDGVALPKTEAAMDVFCQMGYDAAFSAYSGLLPKPIERHKATARSCFLMTLDPAPRYNGKATPLTVSATYEAPLQPSEEVAEQREVDSTLYGDYELMYRRASEEAFDETADVIEPQRYDAYITELARRLCEMGVPEEEAFLHIRNHHVFKHIYEEYEYRAIVSAVYSEERPKRTEGVVAVNRETRELMRFLTTRYVFRFNTVMGYTEYRPNNTWVENWQPCDEQAIYSMTLEARLTDLDVTDKDVRRYVKSDKIRRSDPVLDYLVKVSDKWDGTTDHIGRLARCVACDLPQWETWFKKWFVSMVAQWLLPRQEYGNSIVPLLISPQGDGKTTFCRMLLPPELSWGFQENQDVSDKRATLQAMHHFLLINLDEFNSISPKVQAGFLKNVIQLPSVKIKRPYGKHVEEFKRFASFIATTNEISVLSDPTGSRRFICVRLTAPVDTHYKPNYEALYGQAYQLVTGGEMEWWFTPEEVAAVTRHNEQYQLLPPSMQYFYEYYEAAGNESDSGAAWMSPTAIYDELRRAAGAGLSAVGVSGFGRYLANVPSILQKRSKTGKLYLVKPRKR